MRSSELSIDQYNTDKIENQYLSRYDQILKPWTEKPVKLLELGIHHGGSLHLWKDYFPESTIVGVDLKLPAGFKGREGIHLYEGSQADTGFLSRVAQEQAPEGFDIIIDDASHIGLLTKISFWHLFENHLKPGGLFVIEDWGTGYWSDWTDGRSLNLERNLPTPMQQNPTWLNIWLNVLHYARKLQLKRPMFNHSHGMVGFVKQLVDEQGAHDVTRRLLKGGSGRSSKFDQLIIMPSIVFVKKAE